MSAAQFDIFVYAWIVIGVLMFPVLLFVKQPYGRHTSENFGPMISNKLGWAIMELPSPIVFTLVFLMGGRDKDLVSWFLFALYNIHYFNRSVIYPLRLKTEGKKMPLVIALSAVFFNLINGFVNGYWLGTMSPGYGNEWFYDPRFIAGLGLFIGGFFINNRADQILLNLRAPGETGYKIPKGFLFDYITSPNYFGEILEWTGYALLCWSLPAFSFMIWAMVNLIPRALDHHKWYKQKFTDYPKERKAVFPFIL